MSYNSLCLWLYDLWCDPLAPVSPHRTAIWLELAFYFKCSQINWEYAIICFCVIVTGLVTLMSCTHSKCLNVWGCSNVILCYHLTHSSSDQWPMLDPDSTRWPRSDETFLSLHSAFPLAPSAPIPVTRAGPRQPPQIAARQLAGLTSSLPCSCGPTPNLKCCNLTIFRP